MNQQTDTMEERFDKTFTSEIVGTFDGKRNDGKTYLLFHVREIIKDFIRSEISLAKSEGVKLAIEAFRKMIDEQDGEVSSNLVIASLFVKLEIYETHLALENIEKIK